MSHKILLAALDFAPELSGKYFCNVDPFRKIFPVFSSPNADEETFLRSSISHECVSAPPDDPDVLDAQNSSSPLRGNHSLATTKYFAKARTMLPVLLVSTRPFAQALTPNLLSTTTIGVKILFELFFASHVGLCSFPVGTLQYTRKLSVSYSLGMDFENLQYERGVNKYRTKNLAPDLLPYSDEVKSFWISDCREKSSLVEIFPRLEVFSFVFPTSREYQLGQVILKHDDYNINSNKYAFFEVPENGPIFVNLTIRKLLNLRSLSLYRCSALNHEAIFNITETLPNLHEIELGGDAAKWNYNVLDFIHPSCANRLTHLVLAFPIFDLANPPFASQKPKSLILEKIKNHNKVTNFGDLEVLVLQFPGSYGRAASVFVKNVLDSHEDRDDQKLLKVVKRMNDRDENLTENEFCLWESSLFEKIADNYSDAALPKLRTLMLDSIVKRIHDPSEQEHENDEDESGNSGCFGAKILTQALNLLPSSIKKLDFRFQVFGSNHDQNKKILNDLFAALSGVNNNLRLEWIDLTGCSGVCDRHIIRHLVPKHKDTLIHLGLGFYGDGRELREGDNDDPDCQFTETVFIEGISQLQNLKYLDLMKTSPYIETWKGLTSLVALRNSLEELYLNDITYHYEYEINDNVGGINADDLSYEKKFARWKDHQEAEAIVAEASDSPFQFQYDETLNPNFPLHPLTVNFLLRMKSLKVLAPFNSYHFCSTDLAAILRTLPLLRSLNYFCAPIEYDFHRVCQRHNGYRSNSACKRLHEFRADEPDTNFFSSSNNNNKRNDRAKTEKLPAARSQHENSFSFVRNLLPVRDSFINNGILKLENLNSSALNRMFDLHVEGTDLHSVLGIHIKTGMLFSFAWREFIYRNVMWTHFQGWMSRVNRWGVAVVAGCISYALLKSTSLDDQYVIVSAGIIAIFVAAKMRY